MKIKLRSKIELRGFSLIEILVSVSLFTFVALVSIAALVSSTQLNNKLKVTRSLYDNMYFTMEEMGRELKQGVLYELVSSSEINFTPYQPYSNNFYRYKYKLESGTIRSYKDTGSGFVLSGQLTSDNITINTLKFEIMGAGKYADGDRRQPSVKIIISGVTKQAPISTFNLQSVITQRDTDI